MLTISEKQLIRIYLQLTANVGQHFVT